MEYQFRYKANIVTKIVWTLSGFNISAIAGLWQPLEASIWAVMQLYLSAVSQAKKSPNTQGL